jgi:hypothetical protein
VETLVRAIDVIDRCHNFRQHINNWRTKASINDTSALETLRIYYEFKNRYLDLNDLERESIIDLLNKANDAVRESELPSEVKKFLCKSFDDLAGFLRDLEFYGFEAAWSKSAELIASILRFESELKESKTDLAEKVADAAWKAMKFLAILGGAKDGILLTAATVNLILDPTPAL